MRQLGLAVMAVGFLVGADDREEAKSRAIQAELKKFEGTWRTDRVEAEGKAIPLEGFQSDRLILEGDRFKSKTPRGTLSGVFQVNPAVVPKTIDVTFTDGPAKGKTHEGIYELEGDTYKVCMAHPGKPRPTEFVTRPGSGDFLQVLKREKP
jgi:uncharacterized protein (TIGR03067 family)